MECQTRVHQIALAKGRTLRLDDVKGSEITLTSGCLWITQHLDSADYVLNPAQTFCVSRDGPTLVHALCEASLTIRHGAAPAHSRVGRVVLVEWWRAVRGRLAAGGDGGVAHAGPPA